LLGLHRIMTDPANPVEMFLVVMLNLFAEGAPAEMYDLKGSEVGRTTPEAERKPGVPLKDLDLTRALAVSPASHERLWTAIRRDSLFLSRQGTMDYSLLIGIDPTMTLPHLAAQEPGETAFWTRSRNGLEVYRFGIIDYLVSWDLTKKLEQTFKSFTAEKEKLSAVEPEPYAKRFNSFLEKIFVS